MIWFILLLGLILRLISLDQSLWLDEAINTLAVKNYSLIDLITQYARADFHPPGWFIILWFWAKLFGYSEIAVRMPSVIFGVTTIYITFLLGKKLVSKELGIIAALLLAINPLHIYYSQEARMYSLASLAVSLNILFLIQQKPKLLFLILSNILILASDYVAFLIFPAEFVYLFFFKRDFVKKWMIALVIAIFSGLWWLPTFFGQFNVGGIAAANLPSWKLINGAFDFKTVPLTFVKFIIGRISLVDKILYAAILLPICSLFIFLLYRAKSNSLLLIWLIVPVILATLISIFVPIYNYFRVLFILPAFILLISLGILSFKKIKIILGLIVAIEIFCSLVYLFNPAFQREDWRGLVDYFRNKKSLILFESSGTLPSFEYYADNKLNAKGALKDFPAKVDTDVIDFTGEDIYLVDYLVQISDPDRLVAKKLTDLGYEQKETLNFNGVGFIYHYVK